MRQILLLITIVTLFFSCRKTNNLSQAQQWEREYIYMPGFDIVITKDTVDGKPRTNYGQQRGANMVFQFNYMAGYNDDWMDNEYNSRVAFEIEPNITTFSFTNEELAQAKTHYTGAGAWTGFPQTAIDKGTIKGYKISDSTWRVDIDLVLPEKDPSANVQYIKESGAFTPKYY